MSFRSALATSPGEGYIRCFFSFPHSFSPSGFILLVCRMRLVTSFTPIRSSNKTTDKLYISNTFSHDKTLRFFFFVVVLYYCGVRARCVRISVEPFGNDGFFFSLFTRTYTYTNICTDRQCINWVRIEVVSVAHSIRSFAIEQKRIYRFPLLFRLLSRYCYCSREKMNTLNCFLLLHIQFYIHLRALFSKFEV